jgi:hypothetical protein
MPQASKHTEYAEIQETEIDAAGFKEWYRADLQTPEFFVAVWAVKTAKKFPRFPRIP